jgi:hypothetical protein
LIIIAMKLLEIPTFGVDPQTWEGYHSQENGLTIGAQHEPSLEDDMAAHQVLVYRRCGREPERDVIPSRP